jgi:predicted amidohydrolase YtcJ
MKGSKSVTRYISRQQLLAVTMGLLLSAAVIPTDAIAKTERQSDILFVNGQIYTPNGWQSAMEITSGRISRVGDERSAKRWRKLAKSVVDLKGKTVFPGLYDMHVHPVLQAKGGEGGCRIPQDANAQKLLELVAACVKAAQPGEWITGGQWQASLLEGTPIRAATLDAISPNNPVMLYDVSGHSLWVNSSAMKAAGITSTMPNPDGGIIERDAAGNPTGVLRETANHLVIAKVPPQPIEKTEENLQPLLGWFSSFGIVGYLEAMAFRDDLEVYARLADKGVLKHRIQACIAYSAAGHPNADLDATIADRAKYARANFDPNCIKVFADGVPTESHTGAMLEKYQAGQPNAPERGLLLFNPTQMGANVTTWDEQGITVMFHAAGDGAVRASLDAVAEARKANGMKGPMHQIGHSTFVDPGDLSRFKTLNAAIEFSPYLWDPQPINDDITKAVGFPRMDRAWPIREGFDAKALVIAGSDWAVVPTPNPWIGIETAITRRNPGGSERSFGLGQAINLQQAIDMFTINAARRLGIADDAGSISVGKYADFIILDQNPFQIPVTELHKVQPFETWIAGEKVFERAKP